MDIQQILAGGRYGAVGHPSDSVPADTPAGSRPPSPVVSLGRPKAVSTHLRSRALTNAERTTLTALAPELATELLRVERVHVSPVWKLNHGVSGPDAAGDVDRIRNQARAELSKARPSPDGPAAARA